MLLEAMVRSSHRGNVKEQLYVAESGTFSSWFISSVLAPGVRCIT